MSTQYTRRDFGRVLVGGLAISSAAAASAQRINSVVAGVRLGVQTYSFRDLLLEPGDHLDAVIRAMKQLGLGECELLAVHAEPKEFWTLAGWAGAVGRGGDPFASGTAGIPRPSQTDIAGRREALREWRRTVPLRHFEEVRKRLDTAGINVFAYNLTFGDAFTDEEIDRGFEMAKALGVGIITTSNGLSMTRRLLPFVNRHRIIVAVHGHSAVKDPDAFSTPETFAKALALSEYFRVNLDIGHFTAADQDPVAYIDAAHDRITNLHVKDRRRNDGPNVPWGQGDTPITQVLQLLKVKRYPIPAYIEYEYDGPRESIAEVRSCLDYAKHALA
jgi:sugar phosphate isomerase/epimerase